MPPSSSAIIALHVLASCRAALRQTVCDQASYLVGWSVHVHTEIKYAVNGNLACHCGGEFDCAAGA